MAVLKDREISELETVIETLDTLYEIGEDCIHPLTNQIVSDKEYDILRKKLFDLKPDSYIFADVTASKAAQHNQKVVHNPPMVSISKAIGPLQKRTDVLKDFADKIQDELDYKETEESFLVQAYKRDGVALALYYERGKLVRAGLRPRNGTEGEDVTENVKYVEGVATELWEHDKDGNRTKFLDVTCSIRGEIECKKSTFRKVVEDWQNPKFGLSSEPKNPRNYAAGSIRQFSNPAITKERKLTFTGYSILSWNAKDNSPAPFKTEIQRAKYSNAVLRIPFVQVRKFRWADLKMLEELSTKMDYEVDGVVISVDNLEDAEQMGTHGGSATGNPKSKLAWKFSEESVEVEVNAIVWDVGRTGTLTPVLQFDGVQLDGTTVSQCTGHSLGFLDGSSKASLGEISLWSKIKIIKSGKIIPKVVEVVKRGFQSLTVPTKCPSCDSVLEVRVGGEGKSLVCNSNFCGVRAVAGLVHFLSTIGVKGISDAIVTRLLDEKLVGNPSDFYKLSVGKLTAIGYSKRQALLIVSRLYLHNDPAHATDDELDAFIKANAGKNKIKIPAGKLFASFGISGAGKSAGQSLIAHFGDFNSIKDATLEKLQEIEGLGDVSSQAIVDYFKENAKVVNELLKYIEPEGKKQGTLSGKTFVFTGGFDGGKEVWENKVLDLGASVSGSVGKNTSYVVVGENAGSKEEKAIKLGIPMLTPDKLLALIK